MKNVSTYDFHLPADLFNISRMQSEGYCTNDCLGNGVFNISKCSNGLSAFISLPHFLNADQKFIDDLDGMAPPEQEKHDYILKFQPVCSIFYLIFIYFYITLLKLYLIHIIIFNLINYN